MDFDLSLSQLLYPALCGVVVPLFIMIAAAVAAWSASRRRDELPNADSEPRLEAGSALLFGTVRLSPGAPFGVRLDVAGRGSSRSQFVEIRGAEVFPFTLELRGGEHVEVEPERDKITLRDATDEEGADDTGVDVDDDDETFSVTLGDGETVIARGVLSRDGSMKPDGFRNDVQSWVLRAPKLSSLELTTGAIEEFLAQERKLSRRELFAAWATAPLVALVNVVLFQKLLGFLSNPGHWSNTLQAVFICTIISGVPIALFGRLLPKRPWYMREQKLALVDSDESDA